MKKSEESIAEEIIWNLDENGYFSVDTILIADRLNVSIDKVNDDLRRKAKTINFGIIYGITQYGLAKQISVSNQEALDFINAYFKKFPEIKDYMNTTII